MAKTETWTWRDLITPATVLTIGVIAANVDAKIDRRGEAVEQHLTETDNRLAETTNRLDQGLDRQADMSFKINKIDADLSFIHERIDKLDEPKARGSNRPH
jgi:hypothetical protein